MKTLDVKHEDEQYQDMLQEMMRIAHDTREESDEDARLRRIVGEDNYEVFKGGVGRRRGGGQLPSSAAGRRRARSQALRREKLNSQSLRSHLIHVRRTKDNQDPASY